MQATMGMTCAHGEPRGERYCAFCRRETTIETERLMDRALDAKLEWTVRATQELKGLARTGRPFTADDLVRLVGLPLGYSETNGNNAVGALFRKWSKHGFIIKVGTTATGRRVGHGRQVIEWRGFPAPWLEETQ